MPPRPREPDVPPDARPREPDVPADLEPAGVGCLDDDAVLDEVAIGAGANFGTDALTDGGRTIRGLTLMRSTVTGVRVTGVTFEQAEMADVLVEDCDLSGTTFADAALRRVTFRRCRMSGVVAPDLVASDLRLVDCKADGAWLRAARLEHCELVECDLTGSDWYAARVRDSWIVRCDLSDSELSAVEMHGVALHGSTIAGANGLGSLRNVVIGPDQVLDLALPVLATLGIRVESPDTDDER